MSVRSGWNGVLYWGWENTYGTTLGGSFYTWESEEPDQLSLGEQVMDRGVLWGGRWKHSANIFRGNQLPGGLVGAVPLYFSSNGSHLDALRFMYSHFQGSISSFPIGGRAQSWSFRPCTTSVPTTWRGVSFLRDWGLAPAANPSQNFNWSGGVVDTLTIAWKVGDCLKFKPDMKFLRGSEIGVGTLNKISNMVSSAGCVKQPHLKCYINGSLFNPLAFDIVSKNSLQDVSSSSSTGRDGFTFGDWTGQLKLSVLIEDGYKTWFIDTFGAVGTFDVVYSASEKFGTYASGTGFEGTITMYFKHKEMPAAYQRRGQAIDTLTFEAVSPDGTTSPLTVQMWSDYTGAI